ncbi:unnamed protein product [Allacma fusca]|uniref:Uncharacterized protein n=1 Tax=Allacma fusca TaxID=39272 RepID=A0A8J2PYK0_9HEXA|nr:unnamed protein product [Allacma fusca]
MNIILGVLNELTIVAIVISIISLALALYPIFILFVLVRLVVQLLARIFRPDLKNILDAIHAIFAMGYSKDKALENFVVTGILDGHLSLQEIRDGAQKRGPYDIAVNVKPALTTRGLRQLRPSLIGEEIVCVSPIVNVETVNKIKKHFQVSYAAVLYAAICGAIERAMTKSNQNVPKGLMGGVVVPVPNHPGGICNHVTTAAAKWPIRRGSCPKRLLEIQKDLVALSRSSAIIVYIRASRRAGFAPTVLGRLSPLGAGLIGQMFGFGVMITNFPVTRGPDYFDGHEFLDCTVGVPTVLPCGMFISIGGLNNQQRFNFNVRRNLFASDEICQNLGRYAVEELNELLESTV